MAEEGITPVNLPSSPCRKNNSPFSSSFRFLDFPDTNNSSPKSVNLYELNEEDVVWSPEIYSDLPSSVLNSPSSDGDSSPSDHRRSPSPFLAEKLGLAVALTDVDRRSAAVNVNMRKAAPAKVFRQSAPVNVPVWRRLPSGAVMVVDDCREEEEEEEAEEEMLPPHVIVARSHVTTFSVFEGVGRTLKGRDLCRVRNAVFQKTGFID